MVVGTLKLSLDRLKKKNKKKHKKKFSRVLLCHISTVAVCGTEL